MQTAERFFLKGLNFYCYIIYILSSYLYFIISDFAKNVFFIRAGIESDYMPSKRSACKSWQSVRDRSLFLPEGAGSYQQNTSQKHMTPPFVETKKVMTHSGVTLLEGARGQGMAGCPID